MISTDNGAHWSEATDANFPAGGIDVTFDLPKGITAPTTTSSPSSSAT